MPREVRSYVHVVIQFGLIFYFFLTGPFLLTSFLLISEISGIFLGFWSVWVMRKSVISIFPDPDPEMRLIRKGPYKVIRHPMYTALFLVLIPLVISEPTVYRLIALVVFIVNQIFKLLYEEKLLIEKIPGYKEYSRTTSRVIPFVF